MGCSSKAEGLVRCKGVPGGTRPSKKGSTSLLAVGGTPESCRMQVQWVDPHSSTRHTILPRFLQSLLVPVDVEVFLIGFDGDGGYAHKQDTGMLLNLLSAGLNQHCPHSLETQEELGVCFQLNYEVLGADELGEEVRTHALGRRGRGLGSSAGWAGSVGWVPCRKRRCHRFAAPVSLRVCSN